MAKYHIKNGGNDTLDGLSDATAFATWDKAVTVAVPGDTIAFKCNGTYLVISTNNKDGNSGAKYHVTNYGTGANPVISGFVTPTWTNTGGNIWSFHDPEFTTVNMLKLGNSIRPKGRWPEADYFTIKSSINNTQIADANELIYAPDFVGGELVAKKNKWILDTSTITAQTATTLTTSVASPYTYTTGYGYFVQNHKNCLTKNGDWYYNSHTKTVYLYHTTDPNILDIQIAKRPNCLHLKGSDFWEFFGIDFEGSTEIGAYIDQSEHVKFLRCGFRYHYNALQTWVSKYLTVDYCHFNDVQNIGINNRDASHTVKITNSYLNNIAMIPGASGSGDGHACGIKINNTEHDAIITGNRLHNMGYIGIYYGGNNCLVERNYAENGCMVKSDGALFYTFGPYTGIRVNDNIGINCIGNVKGTTHSGYWGAGDSAIFYMDDNARNISFRRNYARGGQYGFYLHNNQNLIGENNVAINNHIQIRLADDQLGDSISNVNLQRNAFIALSGQFVYELRTIYTNLAFGTFNNNKIRSTDANAYRIRIESPSPSPSTTTQNISQWRANRGYDVDSELSDHDSEKEYILVNSSATQTFSLDGIYEDLSGLLYDGSIEIPENESIYLYKVGDSEPVPNSLPSVVITSPANLSAHFTAPATVPFRATATDDTEVLKVEWYVDAVLVATINTAPFSHNWSGVPAGTYSISARAFDTEGHTDSAAVQVTVNEQVPEPDPNPDPDPEDAPPVMGDMGLQMWVNGDFLELPADFSVQFNRFNPIFQTEGFKQDDYTLPISLPNSDHNARILGNPSVVENENRFPSRMDAVIYYGGMPRVRGQLRIKSPVNSRVITVNFVSGVSEISPDIVNRKLRDVMDEEFVIHSIDWSRQITLRWRDEWSETYGIIINGVTYEEDDMMVFANSINNDPDCAATIHLEADGITSTFIPKDPNELSEFWLDWVEGSIWTLVPSSLLPFWEDYNYIYSDVITGGWLGNKVRFPTNANLNGFVDITQASRWNAYPIINYYTDPELFATNPIIQVLDRTSGRATPRPRVRNNNSLAPYVTVEYVLNRIADYYGIIIKAPFTGAEDEMMIIDHPNTINRPVKYLGDSEMTLYARSFNMASLVPDMNVNEFLKALQGLGYALEYDSASRTLSYVERDPVLFQPSAIDLSGRVGMLEDVQNQPRQGVTLRHKLDNADRIIAEPVPLDANNGQKEYVIGDGEKLLESGFAVPVMLDNTGRFPKESIVPKTVATKDMAADDGFKLRLAFSVTDANGIPRMQIANSEMNLSWYGTFGLANQSWKYWKSLEAGKKEIAVKLYLTDAEVFDPPWFRKVLIDRNKYIISKLDADLSGSGDLIECEAILVKADYSKWLG